MRKLFIALVFANTLSPTESVSVGDKCEIPDGAVPVVRNAFIWTFPLIVTGVSEVGSNTRRLPARKPVDPSMRPLAYTLPFAYTTFEFVSSIKTFEPTQRSCVGKVFAAPMLFDVYMSPYTWTFINFVSSTLIVEALYPPYASV